MQPSEKGNRERRADFEGHKLDDDAGETATRARATRADFEGRPTDRRRHERSDDEDDRTSRVTSSAARSKQSSDAQGLEPDPPGWARARRRKAPRLRSGAFCYRAEPRRAPPRAPRAAAAPPRRPPTCSSSAAIRATTAATALALLGHGARATRRLEQVEPDRGLVREQDQQVDLAERERPVVRAVEHLQHAERRARRSRAAPPSGPAARSPCAPPPGGRSADPAGGRRSRSAGR